ncbi:hypothetical protein BH11MYX3_BH11MYX3_15190 [soil metagenome]
MFRAGAAILVIGAGCSGNAPTAIPEPLPAPPGDAGPATVVAPALDNAPSGIVRPVSKRPGRPIEIILRSVPLGADVEVDGAFYGVTPQVWIGETGAQHSFKFTMRDYAPAQYRFIPVASGILHARLDPLAGDLDAGVDAPPAMLPLPIAIDAGVDAPLPDAFVPDAPPPGLGPQP